MLLDDKNDLQLKRYICIEGESVPRVIGNIAINTDTRMLDVDIPTAATALRAFLADLWVNEEYMKYEFPMVLGDQCKECGAVYFEPINRWQFAHPERIRPQ